MFVPFTKIDREQRMVYGIAQSEEPDVQGDVLSYAASEKAFKAWEKQANVREMHEDIAVGRAVDVQCDPEKKQVTVGVRISKGAENCWQKVLDGTYQGFSIGGYPVTTGTIKKNGRALRHVTAYHLDELSLVDVPANPRCTITAIQKRGNALIATDILGAVRPTKGTAMRKRAKISSLVAFNKNLGANDAALAARMSDFKKVADGYLLPTDAPIAHFSKGDLDGDGYDDASDDVAPDSGINGVTSQDMGENAQSALDAHDDWHQLAGHDECNCDRDDNAVPMNGPGGDEDTGAGGDDDMGKNASRKRRRQALRKRQRAAVGLSKDDVATMLTNFAKGFDEKFEALRVGGDSATRKGDGTNGTLVKRDGEAAGDDANPLTKNATALKEAYAKRDAFNKKGTQGLSSQDRSERELLAREIGSLEMESLELTGAQAR